MCYNGETCSCTGFQTAVLQMLVSMHSEIKDLKKHLDHNTSLLQCIQQDRTEDEDTTLADGPQLPMSTDEDIEAMEMALESMEYRKRLVRELNGDFCLLGMWGLWWFIKNNVYY